jgi:hypothetical protein
VTVIRAVSVKVGVGVLVGGWGVLVDAEVGVGVLVGVEVDVKVLVGVDVGNSETIVAVVSIGDLPEQAQTLMMIAKMMSKL